MGTAILSMGFKAESARTLSFEARKQAACSGLLAG